MSFPMHAPASKAAAATEPLQVSIDIGKSNLAAKASTPGIVRSNSSASVTSGPGPALTPPTSRKSAPLFTWSSASRRKSSKDQYFPRS